MARWVLLLLAASSFRCTATSIAVAFERNRVSVASDSLVVVQNGESAVRESGCKLIQERGMVFAASGFLFLNGRDVRDLARSAIRSGKNTEEARDAFTEAAVPLLRNAFQWARKNAPAVTRELAAVFVSGDSVHGVLLFERENLPFPAIEFSRLDCGTECGRETFFMLGAQEHARRLFPQLLKDRRMAGARLAERLVQTEIDASPAQAQGPLQVARITRKRVEWVRRPAVCQPGAQNSTFATN